ncbi:MAG: MFS transporter, partial [Acidimicrobiales bacterium]
VGSVPAIRRPRSRSRLRPRPRPRSRRPGLAAASLAYLVGVILTTAIPNPLGSNVGRLALLFGGPVLLALVARGRLAVAVVVLLGGWQLSGVVPNLAHARDPAASPAHVAGLVAELHRVDAGRTRVEVVPERDHWESAQVVTVAPLARGWERQVDVARNPVFYNGRLTASSYRRWLGVNAVAWVALPAGPLDWRAGQEARILRQPHPWLHEVWHDRWFTLWKVDDPTPLVSAPGSVLAYDPAGLTLSVPYAATVVIKMAWSPWLTVVGGQACLRPHGRWTELVAQAGGRYRLTSSYKLPRGSPCPA